jgi:hypothetical protein
LQTDDPGPGGDHAEDTLRQSRAGHLHRTIQSRTLDCHRCRGEATHTWRQWRPWYMLLSRRQWLEGWVCERCGARKYVWHVKRGRRY